MKTARFAEVVEASGAPETYLLWTPAAEDKAFQRALKEHRIMTLHQELRGAKKDYGTVGFHEEPNAQFLIFPKSLRRFAERKIIAVNYDLLAKDDRPAPVAASQARKKISASAKERTQRTPTGSAGEKEKLIEFVPPEPPPEPKGKTRPQRAAPKPESRPRKAPASSPSPADRRLVAEVEKAMKELRAGKSIVAYQRLESLVQAARASASARSPDEPA